MSGSIWTKQLKMPEFPRLEGRVKTNILIIGGGICGILCAYFLDLMGEDYILAEGNRICSGITHNTTAKITSQHGSCYKKMLDSYGKEKASLYLKANERALSLYSRLAKNIDCDFEIKPNYVYSMKSKKDLKEEVRAAKELGFDAEFLDATELPFKTKGAVRFKDQAQFHPLKFISHIAKDLNIYENTFIKDLSDPKTARSSEAVISANKIIVASHFPFINKHGSYFMKLYQHRSYVLAVENAPMLEGMYVDADKKGMSFRCHKDLLFIGGGGHRTGKPGGSWKELRDFKAKYFPDAKEVCHWAAQDCMSLDGIPYIGRYSKNTPDLYVASGFNKWGMTSSIAAAEMLSSMVTGKESEFLPVFSPQRSVIKPQLFINSFESAKNLLSPTTKRCSHLGCALKWNKAEHTWDCPCHGSRFEANGQIIDNPAQKNSKIE